MAGEAGKRSLLTHTNCNKETKSVQSRPTHELETSRGNTHSALVGEPRRTKTKGWAEGEGGEGLSGHRCTRRWTRTSRWTAVQWRSSARGKSFSPFSLLLLFGFGGGRREEISLQKSCLMGGKEKANRRVGKVIC